MLVQFQTCSNGASFVYIAEVCLMFDLVLLFFLGGERGGSSV